MSVKARRDHSQKWLPFLLDILHLGDLCRFYQSPAEKVFRQQLLETVGFLNRKIKQFVVDFDFSFGCYVGQFSSK